MDIAKLKDDLQFCIQRQNDALCAAGLAVSKNNLIDASWWIDSAEGWQELIDDIKHTIDAEVREAKDDPSN